MLSDAPAQPASMPHATFKVETEDELFSSIAHPFFLLALYLGSNVGLYGGGHELPLDLFDDPRAMSQALAHFPIASQDKFKIKFSRSLVSIENQLPMVTISCILDQLDKRASVTVRVRGDESSVPRARGIAKLTLFAKALEWQLTGQFTTDLGRQLHELVKAAQVPMPRVPDSASASCVDIRPISPAPNPSSTQHACAASEIPEHFLGAIVSVPDDRRSDLQDKPTRAFWLYRHVIQVAQPTTISKASGDDTTVTITTSSGTVSCHDANAMVAFKGALRMSVLCAAMLSLPSPSVPPSHDIPNGACVKMVNHGKPSVVVEEGERGRATNAPPESNTDFGAPLAKGPKRRRLDDSSVAAAAVDSHSTPKTPALGGDDASSLATIANDALPPTLPLPQDQPAAATQSDQPMVSRLAEHNSRLRIEISYHELAYRAAFERAQRADRTDIVPPFDTDMDTVQGRARMEQAHEWEMLRVRRSREKEAARAVAGGPV